jgi:hypothetical protein
MSAWLNLVSQHNIPTGLRKENREEMASKQIQDITLKLSPHFLSHFIGINILM